MNKPLRSITLLILVFLLLNSCTNNNDQSSVETSSHKAVTDLSDTEKIQESTFKDTISAIFNNKNIEELTNLDLAQMFFDSSKMEQLFEFLEDTIKNCPEIECLNLFDKTSFFLKEDKENKNRLELIKFKFLVDNNLSLKDTIFTNLETNLLLNQDSLNLSRLYSIRSYDYEINMYDPESIVSYRRKSLNILKPSNQRDSILCRDAMINLVTVYGELNQSDSVEYFLSYLEKLDSLLPLENSRAIEILGNKGALYNVQSKFFEAREALRKAINLCEKNPHIKPEKLATMKIMGMVNLGFTYENMGDFERSIKIYKEAANEVKNISGFDEAIIASLYNNLGMAYKESGDYFTGLEYCKEGLSIRKRIYNDYHLNLANSYHNVGYLYFLCNNIPLAKKNLYECVKQMEKTVGPFSFFMGYPYDRLGMTFQKAGQMDSSLFYLKEAIEVRIKAAGGNHPQVAYAYNSLGILYLEKKEYSKASESFETSYDIYEENFGEKSTRLAYPLSLLADSYLKEGHVHRADSIIFIAEKNEGIKLEKIETNFKNISSERNILDLIETRTKIILKDCNNTKCLSSVYNLYKNQLKIIDYFYAIYANKKSRQYLIEKNYKIYENILDLFNSEQFQYDEIDAFKYVEEARCRELKEVFVNEDLSILPSEMKNRLHDIEVDINYFSTKLQINNNKQNPTVVEVEKVLFDLKQKQYALVDTFKTLYPEYYRTKYKNRVIDIEGIQDSLLSKNQALIEYFVGDSTIYVFSILKDTSYVHQIQKDFPLEEWVEDMLCGMTSHFVKNTTICGQLNETEAKEKYIKSSHDLYQKIFLPVASLFSKETEIIIVPDGVLGYIPFDALLVEQPTINQYPNTYEYLLKYHAISYAYSATLQQEMQYHQHDKKPKKNFLAYAPTFGTQNTEKVLASSGFNNRANYLSPLKYNTEEVQVINNIMDGDLMIGKDAIKESFIKQASDYRILHLSTHGEANDKLGDYSFLAFYQLGDSLENNWLYNRELYTLKLNADMVVLSACETGIGELQKGEGIISLSRGFSYAGAKSIITSLWRVNDKSTKVLMELFYEHLNEGMSKNKALRQAKLDYLEGNPNLGHEPYFWAAFIPIGDMSPIEMSDSCNVIWGLLLSLALVIIFFLRYGLKRNK